MTRFYAITDLVAQQAHILPEAQMDRLLDNRDPRNWSQPVLIGRDPPHQCAQPGTPARLRRDLRLAQQQDLTLR